MSVMNPLHVFPRSRPPQSSSSWWDGARWLSLLIVLVLVSADMVSQWAAATPVQAKSGNTTQTNSPLSAPSWLTQASQSSPGKLPNLNKSASVPNTASQSDLTPQPLPVSMRPDRLALSTSAQQFFSSDGQLEVDVPTNALDATQLKGGIWLYLNQVKPASGGLPGSQISFGTYEFQWFDGSGKPLSTVKLHHPLTIHYHLRPDQAASVVKGQQIYTIWNGVKGASTAPSLAASQSKVQTAVAPQALPNQKPALSYAHSDSSGLDWSIQSNLSASSTKTGLSTQTTTASALVLQASSVSFNTQAPQATWGTPTQTQVSLNSGGLTFNYPLSVPPGPGSFQPSLSLNYSSGSVNENHGWQSAAPWVGQGWSLDLGSISWAQENVTPNGSPTMESVWRINDPSGIGGQLIPPDLTYSTNNATLNPSLSQLQNTSNVYIWHSAPESHAKIREVAFSPANCWQVYLPNGTREDFGCTNDSRESYQDSSGNWDTYSWKLDLMIDRYGNQVHVSYSQVFPTGYVRDAAISDITYDDPTCHNTSSACSSWNPLVDIHFDAGQSVANLLNGGCGSGTSTARCDDPQDLSGTGGMPAPKVMSAYVLNDVKVQVQGNLLHEYVFSYNQGGPGTTQDPNTGQQESYAGYLTLGKIQEEGTNGTSLNAPVINVTYAQQWQHYSDLISYSDNGVGDICSPYSNAPRDGSSTGPCYLWSQSFNQYYIANLDNGRGWNESVSWKEAHSNTWGTDGGTNYNNAFQCSSSQTSTNVCGRADDKNWSRVVVASRTDTTNGVSSTWSYNYYLTTVNASIPGYEARSCSGGCESYDWGNQNDDDSSDYYNGDFQSFSQTQVTRPDGSSQTDTFDSTNGWGLYSGNITCQAGGPCTSAPYNASNGPVLAGKQLSEQDYDSHGNLLKQVNTSWSTNCPPQGVPGSANAGGGSIDPGGSFLFSYLDHNNPTMVCDPRSTQADTYTTDGVTTNLSDPPVVHNTMIYTYDGNTCGSTGYDYGNVSKQDQTANDVGGTHIVGTTLFCPNDNIGGGVYLTSLPAQTQMQDGSGTQYGCTLNYYGGNSSYTIAPTLPGLTRSDAYTSYTGGCTGGVVTTLHGFDASGNGITGTDPDGHLGCTSGSSQYSTCATYDSMSAHMLTATNAKNQVMTYEYDQNAPEAGFGEWLMAQTDANGLTTTYTYDALGRLTSVIKPGDSVSSPTITYAYINTCSAGKTTPCLEIDTSTRLTTGGSTMVTEKQWYDGWGNLVETQTPGPNLFSKVPAIGSAVVAYILYDNMGRATTKSETYAVAATAGLGYIAPDQTQPRTVTGYDSLGRTLGTVTYGHNTTIVQKSAISYAIAQGVPTISSESSNAYEQAITLDAYNHQSIVYTDGLGRDRYEQVFSGTTSPYSVIRTVGTTYDVVGNTLSTLTYDNTGTLKASYNAAYDGLKELVGFNDSDSGSCSNTPLPPGCSSSTDLASKISYDANGNQVSQSDARGQALYTSYDALNRPLCEGTSAAAVNPCQNSDQALYFYDSYDNASNPGVTFPTGCVAPSGSYASYPIGLKVAETFSSSAGSGWRCAGFDQRGRQDQAGLSVTADSQTTTQTVSIGYDDADHVTSLVYPDGETLTSQYDTKGFFRSAYFGTPNSSDPVNFLIGQMSYTNSGQIAGISVGGSAAKSGVPTPVFSVANTYDSIQRPLSSTLTRNGTTIWSQTRTYDNMGNVLGLSTTLPTTSGGSKTDVQSFCYDSLNRLVWAGNAGTPSGGDHCGSTPSGTTVPTYQQPFSYDSLDRFVTGPSGTTGYDTSHVHAATTLGNVPNTYASYDAMGDMVCRNVDTTTGHTCATGSQTGAAMTYDNVGRLSSWTAPSGTTASDSFLYDNAGQRVLQRTSTTSGVTDTITFDSYTEVSISGGTTTTTKYYSADGLHVAMRKNGTLSYLSADALGSNTLALNSNGTTQAVQLFAPFGTVRYTDGTMPTVYNFTGQRLDSLTGLLYYGFRYYDPLSGAFARTDTTITNANGADTYAYVGGNPEGRTDANGHCWPLCTAIAGAIIGGVVGAAISVAVQTSHGGKVNWGQVGEAAAGGALVGAALGVAGPAFIAGGVAVAGGAGVGATAFITATDIAIAAPTAVEVGLGVGGIAGAATGIVQGMTDNGGACSFTPDTLVTTADGKKSISTLQVGDTVLAYNPNTHKMELQPIQHVWVHSDNDLIDVTLTTLTTHKGGKTSQQKEQLHTTSEHPFLTKEKGFLPAGQLKPGMHVLRADGSVGVVTAWKHVPGTAVMYNLTVQQDHTFVVGVDQWVVHNVCTPTQQQILTRLRKEVKEYRGTSQQVNKSLRPDDPPGTTPRATNSISELYDSNGNMVARGISDVERPDSIFGNVNCSEGNCLINGRFKLQSYQTYSLYTAQIEGKPACPTCVKNLQIAANESLSTIEVYHIDASGNISDPPDVYSPSPVYPDVAWESEEESAMLLEDF